MPLTVKYVDKDTGNEIADGYSSFVYYGETYETAAKDIPGYEPAGDNRKTFGEYGAEPVEVIYSYKEAMASLTVQYIDEDGNEILAQDEESYSFYSNYSVSQKDIQGYEYVGISSTSASVKGMITANKTTVVFVYQPKDVNITVKHVDGSGKEIAAKEIITRKYKESYTTLPKGITGYVLTETLGNASGQVLAEDFTVTYVYAIDDSNTKTLSATVRYSLNGKLQDEETVTKTVQILSEETTLSTDSIHEKAYEGWVLNYITINDEERFSVLPETVEDKDVVIFVYKKAPASVTVLYQDEDGRENKEFGEDYEI